MDKKKVDFRSNNPELYRPPSQKVTDVVVPEMLFLMIEGQGDPNGDEFQEAVEDLYSIAYGIKFWPKKHEVSGDWFDYMVSPLEALWWAKGFGDSEMFKAPREDWRWRAMIRQPEFVDVKLLGEVKNEVSSKKPSDFLEKVYLERFDEGRSIQIMHIGAYAEEVETIAKINYYAGENGLKMAGRHHEIYLSDPRRTKPGELKSVLRHPVREK
jgi:hypothetical protein